MPNEHTQKDPEHLKFYKHRKLLPTAKFKVHKAVAARSNTVATKPFSAFRLISGSYSLIRCCSRLSSSLI